ncbi:arylesterase [Oleispirillum naphthae]|uniref:arylesterase n=1 Tax=Oleispirillum naphthae TaxID=2838853 RepID=UPI0030823F33
MSVLRAIFCILVALAAVPAHAAPPLVLVALGDSLTAGYGLPQDAAFPSVLARRLTDMGWQVEVRNAGVSGDTTAGGLARLDWALTPPPDAVILELGANDALRGLPPAEAKANLAAMLKKLKEKNVPALLAGMRAPRNLGAAYATEFDAIYPALAAEFGVPLYPFFLAGVAADPRYVQPDGLHPTREGVEIVVNAILPQVEELLDRAAKGAR